jgi:hypothetical protein
MKNLILTASVLMAAVAAPAVCAAQVTDVYRDPRMDFGSVQTVAVAPFSNLTRDQVVAERVRDVFINRLLASGAVYVLPVGEVSRGLAKAEIQNPMTPTTEEVVKLGGILKVDAVITGVVREYGEVRSGSTASNVISLSIQLVECSSGRIVWSGSSTKGGVSFRNRLLGGGGQPLNRVTEQAIDALFDKLLAPPPKGQ